MPAHPSQRGVPAADVAGALVRRGLLDPAHHDEAAAVVADVLAGTPTERSALRQRLAEVGGYVGAAFVLAAAALFVADQWAGLSPLQRVGLLVGIAVPLALTGLAVGLTAGGVRALREGAQSVRRRLASVLFTGAAAVAAGAVGVGVDDAVRSDAVLDGGNLGNLPGLVASLTLAVLAAGGYLLAPTVLGQLAIAAGAVIAVPFALDGTDDADAIATGVLVAAIGAVWLVLAETGRWREVDAARVVGAVLVVLAAQLLLGSSYPWLAYAATAAVGVAGFGVYLSRRAWQYLAMGVAGVTLAVPEALLDWTEGSLGTAGVLLVAGAAMLVGSVVGLRLRRREPAGP